MTNLRISFIINSDRKKLVEYAIHIPKLKISKWLLKSWITSNGEIALLSTEIKKLCCIVQIKIK